MSTKIDAEAVLAAVYATIDEINELQPLESQILKAPETVLMGPGSVVDSMGMVSFVVTLEQRLADTFGVPITLADERALSRRSSPFRTVSSLVTYAVGLVGASLRG